jgi:hypothetical protein
MENKTNLNPVSEKGIAVFNLASKLELALQNPALACNILLNTQELHDEFHAELNWMLKASGQVYTTKLNEECTKIILSRFVLAGKFSK